MIIGSYHNTGVWVALPGSARGGQAPHGGGEVE